RHVRLLIGAATLRRRPRSRPPPRAVSGRTRSPLRRRDRGKQQASACTAPRSARAHAEAVPAPPRAAALTPLASLSSLRNRLSCQRGTCGCGYAALLLGTRAGRLPHRPPDPACRRPGSALEPPPPDSIPTRSCLWG